MIRFIVFDLDGTLIDSRRDIADSINELLGTYHAAPLPLEQVLTMVGEGARLLIRRALTATGVDASLDEAYGRFVAIYDRRLVDHTRLYDGVLDLLQALDGQPHARAAQGGAAPTIGDETIGDEAIGGKAAGDEAVGDEAAGDQAVGDQAIGEAAVGDRAAAPAAPAAGSYLRLAVLTNKPGAPARRILDELGIAAHFTAVVGGDSPLPRKPDPQALLTLCADAGVAPAETLMVGDSWVDVETARRAGTHACFVTFGFGLPPADGLVPGEWQVDRALQLLEVVARLNEAAAAAAGSAAPAAPAPAIAAE